MKVAVIGGGSSYTPELINGFMGRVQSFPLTELWLMDVLPERLNVVGKFAQRMVAAKGSPFRVHLTTNQKDALKGASYVLTQLRVGWMQARREDEYLGKRHQLIGQETTGVGGMANALRTIPVVMNIARDVQKFAEPGALFVNFTNPAGLVTQALTQYAPEINSVGVCNATLKMKMGAIEKLAEKGIVIEPDRAKLDTLGLNHLTWHRSFSVDGKDLWPRVLELTLEDLKKAERPEWPPALIESLQMIPNYYLTYFYDTRYKISEQEKWPPSRAETVVEIEAQLLAQYAEPNRSEPPEGLLKRGGAYYSTVATQLLNAHFNDLQEEHVVNLPNKGAVAGWPDNWVLELPAIVGRSGLKPIPTKPLPPVVFGLMQKVKIYEMLTVEAAIHGDRNAAYQALITHPLGPSAAQAEAVLTDMLNINKPYLPHFFEKK
jgi:6-phospho-beta-glucosidase